MPDNEKTGRSSCSRSAGRKSPVYWICVACLTWFTNRVFEEDREIVEIEQAAYDAQGADWNQEIFPAIRDLRELLSRCGRAIS